MGLSGPVMGLIYPCLMWNNILQLNIYKYWLFKKITLFKHIRNPTQSPKKIKSPTGIKFNIEDS
jgi:hypothetical protein